MFKDFKFLKFFNAYSCSLDRGFLSFFMLIANVQNYSIQIGVFSKFSYDVDQVFASWIRRSMIQKNFYNIAFVEVLGICY